MEPNTKIAGSPLSSRDLHLSICVFVCAFVADLAVQDAGNDHCGGDECANILQPMALVHLGPTNATTFTMRRKMTIIHFFLPSFSPFSSSLLLLLPFLFFNDGTSNIKVLWDVSLACMLSRNLLRLSSSVLTLSEAAKKKKEEEDSNESHQRTKQICKAF